MSITFTAPGPGRWELEAAHHGLRPLSGYLVETYCRAFETGLAEFTRRYGLPLETVRMRSVEGCTYFRPIAVGAGDKASTKAPPALVMKLLIALHPELRRRRKTAERAFRDRIWRDDVDRWFAHDKTSVEATNLEFQSVDPVALTDAELVDYVERLRAHFELQATANMANHGGDMIPIGDYLAHCAAWGVDFPTAAALLRGSSPATTRTAVLLAPVAAAITAAPTPPTSVEAVRALGPEAADAVDTWAEHHAWRVVTSDDVDRPTLAERPIALLAALLAATRPPDPTAPDPTAVRERIPVDARAEFDDLLAEARYGLRQRDDVVGSRWNWSVGLLRRGLLDVGRRLAERGALDDPEHVVELAPAEVGPLLSDGRGPTAPDLAARAARRDAVQAAPPPPTLGPAEAEPPLDVFPPAMTRVTIALLTSLEAETSGRDAPLEGSGVGSSPYTGRAVVATDADDALDRITPGDVLVAPFTGPSYNSVFPLLGGLVVDIGGAMSHAAIASREFQVPAVIGASGATSQIPDGALVEVDPIAGAVRVVG